MQTVFDVSWRWLFLTFLANAYYWTKSEHDFTRHFRLNYHDFDKFLTWGCAKLMQEEVRYRYQQAAAQPAPWRRGVKLDMEGPRLSGSLPNPKWKLVVFRPLYFRMPLLGLGCGPLRHKIGPCRFGMNPPKYRVEIKDVPHFKVE